MDARLSPRGLLVQRLGLGAVQRHVDVDGRALYRIGASDAAIYSIEECLNCGVAGWGWSDNHWGVPGALGADLYFATSGSHTIRIQPREDGLSLDQIVL